VANPPAADMEPSPAEQLLAKAEKFDRQGKLPEARDALREAVKLDPKLTVANLALGVVLRRMGDLEGSVEACSAGIRVDPLDSELYLRRGIAWYHRGLYGIALEDFEDASGIAYDDPRPELWRGLTLMQLGRPQEAINAYAASIRRDRTFMIAYLNRGTAYLATGDAAKAEFDFDLSLRHDPRDVRAWFNRGVALAQQRKYEDAIKSYEMALKIDPSHAGARRNLEAARSRLSRRSGGGISSAASSSTSSAGSALQRPQPGVEVLRLPPRPVGL
jgi:tetratricopeptide (TPR) repeat protein